MSFVYFDAICKSNNIVMLKLLFIIFFQRFINVVSRFPPPEDSRLPLFPLPPPVTFLPCSRPPVFPPPPHKGPIHIGNSHTLSRFFVADKQSEDSRKKSSSVWRCWVGSIKDFDMLRRIFFSAPNPAINHTDWSLTLIKEP